MAKKASKTKKKKLPIEKVNLMLIDAVDSIKHRFMAIADEISLLEDYDGVGYNTKVMAIGGELELSININKVTAKQCR